MVHLAKFGNFGASTAETVSRTKKSIQYGHTVGPFSNRWKAK